MNSNSEENVSNDLETMTELREHITTLEQIFAERQRVMEAIPECPVHGSECVPHALEWIKQQRDSEKSEKEKVEAEQRGSTFLYACRAIIAECSQLRERAARVSIFCLCILLDGSGEISGPEYVLSVRNEQGELEPVIFDHHDL